MEELLVINDEKEKYENELPELRKKITCLEKENDFLTEQVLNYKYLYYFELL